MKHSEKEAGMSKMLRNERGQGMVEYILIVALVVVGAIATWITFGDTIQSMLSTSATELGTAKDALDKSTSD